MKMLFTIMACLLLLTIVFLPQQPTEPFKIDVTNLIGRFETLVLDLRNLAIIDHFFVIVDDLQSIQQGEHWYDPIYGTLVAIYDVIVGTTIAVVESLGQIVTALGRLFGFNYSPLHGDGFRGGR